MSDAVGIGGAAPSIMRASLARTGKWAGAIGAVGGFIADILQPLAPFAAFVALVAAVAALVVAIAIVLRLVLAAKAMPALVFAATTAAIAGGVYALQQASDAEDGLLAGLVPAVAELQQSMGIVAARVEKIEQTVTETQKSVEDVRRTTEKVEKTTEEIAATQAEQARLAEEARKKAEAAAAEQARQAAETRKKADEIAAAQAEEARLAEEARKRADAAAAALAKQAEDAQRKAEEVAAAQARQAEQLRATTEQIAVSIDRIADGFAALAAQGGIIADPGRPDEFYHNARVHELSGDMLNARRSYLAFANLDVDAIDPYTRFATLLRVQDGKAGAREVFGTLAAKAKARSIKLVHALQFEDPQRLGKLNAFIAENPDYPPAYFLLAQEFSEDRLGVQSLADKREEAQALTRFVSYEKDGGLLEYFVDHTELAAWLDTSRTRLAAVGGVLDPALFAPRLIPQRTNDGWMVTVTLPEPATAISWRLGKEGAFAETGFLPTNDQRTGKPMPNPSFAVPDDTGVDTIALKYLDIRGRETGPFDMPFDPQAALVEGNKQLLEQFWTSWIAFDASGNTGNVYFSHLLSYRCAIKAVRYSLDGDALDKALELPACNPKDPYALPDGFLPFFAVGPEVKSMSVQVTYADGSLSPLRVFRR